jgi:hypothetical protein
VGLIMTPPNHHRSTYLTANATKTLCQDAGVDYKLPVAATTSAVNVVGIAWKDVRFAQIFGSRFGTAVKRFPASSYALFAIRDG